MTMSRNVAGPLYRSGFRKKSAGTATSCWIRFTVMTVLVGCMFAAAPAPSGAANEMIDDESVTVPGDEASPWEIELDLIVGREGTGELTIENGGIVTNGGDGSIGYFEDASGTVTVTGDGSTWESQHAINVGFEGTGELIIQDGGRVISHTSVLGIGQDSSGTATVTGPGSTWESEDALFVGSLGTGELTIEKGGSVTSGAGYIDNESGASSIVTVTGTNSTWVSAGDLTVGRSGTGELTVENGGSVTNTNGYVGNFLGASSIVTVSGQDSTWENVGDLVVGHSGGTGELIVENGGSVINNLVGYIGYGEGATGTVTVTGAGSTWESTDDLYVGHSGGAGELTVENGGSVTNGDGHIGWSQGPGGTVTVTGDGSSWIVDHVYVGSRGTGELTIKDGGNVTNLDGYIGSREGSSGTVTVTGGGSTWESTDSLFVGNEGTGELTIENGGRVTNNLSYIGSGEGASGTVTVTGDSSAWSAYGLYVGNEGTGALTIENGGSATNNNGYIGHAAGSSGIVTVTGVGSIWASADDLYVGSGGTGELIVAGGGSVSALEVVIGFSNSATGTLHIGARAGEGAAAAGSLDTDIVTFGDGDGSLSFNHTETDYIFAPVVGGDGTIRHIAGTTTFTGDSSGFAGSTEISGGVLRVAGTLGGSLTVTHGGTLGGSGTVGSTTVADGGTLAPGSSIGTLTVDGDVTFHTGSNFEVEVDDEGNTDHLHATGKAILEGGTMLVLAAGSKWNPLTNYAFLTADGGVDGKFDGIDANFAFLSPELTYTPEGITLELKVKDDFSDVGTTPNQRAVGEAVGALGLGHPLYDAVVGLDEETARQAFGQLSGEIHAGVRGALLTESGYVRNRVTGRLRQPAGEDAASGGFEIISATTSGVTVWGNVEGDEETAPLDGTTTGFFTGADGQWGRGVWNTWQLGVAGGYTASALDADARGTSALIDSIHLAGYGGTRWSAYDVLLGGSYTTSRVDVSREIAFSGFSDEVTADYRANTMQLFAEASRAIEVGSAEVEPYAELAFVRVGSTGFSEEGGDAALQAENSVQSVAFATVGTRAESEVEIGGTRMTARGALGWRQAMGDAAPVETVHFVEGDAFDVAGNPITGSLLVEAGLGKDLSDALALNISYAGEFGGSAQEHGLHAEVALGF